MQQPAARLAQSLQLRVPPGQRHRLREQRVRRAAHQRQRLADAHELSARRQHQHRERSRRAAHAAGLRGAGARGEGHHQRLRAGVRPDDRAWSTTPSRRRAPTTVHGSASFRFRRNAMSERPFFLAADRAQAGHRGQRRHRRRSAGRSCATSWHFFGAYEFVDRSLITGGQVITVTPANAARARASRCRRAASFRRTSRSTSAFGKIDHQFNASQPAVGALLPLQELLRVEHRRRPDDARTARPTSPTGWTRPRRSWCRMLGARMLNELRVQYARRHQFRTPAPSAVDGPAITVTGIAQFGGAAPRRHQRRSASTSTRASGR